jgi:putative transposase
MILTNQSSAPVSKQLDFASEKIRTRTTARRDVVLYVDGLVAKGLSQRKAVEQLRRSYEYELLEPELMRALCAAAVAGRGCPSKAVISQWRKTLKAMPSEDSAAALMPKWQGKVTAPAPWMAQAAVIYNAPSKPAAAAVHRELTEVHGYTCTYDMVLGYLRALPAQYGEQSAARMGSNLHRLKLKPYKPRTTENMLAGDVYAADGYRADVLIAHPITGDIWRPELTVGMDVRSRFIVG